MNFSTDVISQWCQSHFSEHLSLLKTLAAIPAPSHQEDRRAEYIKNWLEEQGAARVCIDDAKNVVLSFGCEGRKDIRVCMAHTDVVFPDTTVLPVREEGGKLYAPGVGDDTANVAALMLCIKFFLTQNILPPVPTLIVFNSCEEGLGNLKGVRQIMSDYAGRIQELISFDCHYDAIVYRAVGSHRWRVNVTTPGGHSFSNFGSPNAITHLAKLIGKLDSQNVPEKPGCKTTFNVGLISGGTSVNTIPQNAEMIYEYRSDDRECLSIMEAQFHHLLEESSTEDVMFTAESLGIRPCSSNIPEDAHRDLLNRCRTSIQQVTHVNPVLCAASTDANIPLSLGIPAATFGLYRGGGAHTRQEYVEIDSLTPGLCIGLSFLMMQ